MEMKFEPHFDGPDYDPELDHARLFAQLHRVRRVMGNGQWWTLAQISEETADPEASISARIRDLRKKRFGLHQIDKRRKGTGGQWEYRLLAKEEREDKRVGRIIRGTGSKEADIFILGQNPGKTEERFGYPFVEKAPAGRELTERLTAIGLSRYHDVWITNLYPYHLEGDKPPTEEQVAAEIHYLNEELEEVNPKWIVPLGAMATRHFLPGVTMERVHAIPHLWKDKVVLPIYHPAAGLHTPETMAKIVYGFEILNRLLRGRMEPVPPIDQYPEPVYREIHSPDEVVERIMWSEWVGVDTEGWEDKPWGLSFSVAPGEGYVIRSEDCLQAFHNALALHEGCKVVFLNALHDIAVLRSLGVETPRYVDEMVAAYLLCLEPQGLKDLAYRHAGMEMSSYMEIVQEAQQRLGREYFEEILKHKWPVPDVVLEMKKDGTPHFKQPQGVNRLVRSALKALEKNPELNLHTTRWKKWAETVTAPVEKKLGPFPVATMDDVDLHTAIHYASRDADATLRVWPTLKKKIEALDLGGVLDMDMRVLPLIERMMKVGMAVDIPHFEQLGEEMAEEMLDLNHQAMAETNNRITNLGSPDQVAEYLFEYKQIQGIKKTKSGSRYSVKDEFLEALRPDYPDEPVIPLRLDYEKRKKIKGTYADKLPMWARSSGDGRIHATLRITRVASGRLSSSDPNLLAQPKRSQLGKRVRGGFVAPEGCLLGSWDLSQIELRVLAHESQDATLLSVFREGRDLHDETERGVFGSSGVNRGPAKTVNFGIVYGLTAPGLQLQLMKEGIHWTLTQCEAAINGWFENYPGVYDYMVDKVNEVRRYGYVRDMWGRLRYLPNVKSPVPYLRGEAERQAGNHPIQAGAQGIIKKAMGRIWEEFLPFMWGEGLHVEPLLQIHDELLFEFEEGIEDLMDTMIRSYLESTVELSVPVLSEGSWGKRWDEL